ncbi:hypothetical protein F4806DRAFT_4852 [Annulohypoxylon nitens]|nr:hypothetical protein F4806DRAFT_4852 [Annulohypoxylon nitens]
MVVIFTGGKSTAINSPRHLTLRHARRTVFRSKLALGLASAEDDDGPDLAPGEERLNSFWAPALVAGPKYEITATQTVNAPSNDSLLLVSRQDFTVDAPQFSLPEGSIYSTYPPPAYPDDHRILPHIVLSDPHLPWERIGSPSTEKVPDNRNKVPWLVLLSFTQDELKLQPGTLGSLDFKQNATLSIKMTVGDLQQLPNVATPNYKDVVDVADRTGEFVFIKPDLFKSLFSKFDSENNRVDAKTPYTQSYKFLSHVRKINTTGMAVAGTEDVGIFSVVVSGRTGPMHNKAPATVAVHLLSIEGVEDMEFPGADKNFVSLCSLHSWNYTVMPPGMLNVFDAFTALGKTLNVLRPPDEIINSLRGTDRVPNRVASRLKDGYSLVKYRLQTGEQTVALCRGPFTPSIVLRFDQFDKCSNSGQDLQILDQEIGIMDVTYSSAWQLGRVLAAGDQSFTAALSRFRSAIHTAAIKASKEEAIIQTGTRQSFRSRTDVLGDLKETVKNLDQIHLPQRRVGNGNNDDGNEPTHPRLPDDRWYRRPLKKKEYPHLGLNQDLVGDKYLTFAIQAALELSMAKNDEVYDETNSPVSTDWMVILAWIMDRMFLAGVPAHYLLTDPSHLGPESLRFFHIDPNWVDALIDGALSLGNHQGTDKDREAIKCAINRYVEYLPSNQPHRPQIPTYGFYLRSDLVTMFPDLKVTTLPEPPEGTRPERAPLLRHEIVTDGVMLGLFDRVPGSDEFTGLKFTQPPHQQRFAAADSLSTDRVTINIRKQSTVSQEERKNDPNPHRPLQEIEMHPGDQDNWFVWDSKPKPSSRASESDEEESDDGEDDDLGPENDLRVLRLPHYADEQLVILQDKMGTFVDGDGHDKKYFDDNTATSALFAMQLNDPIYYLQINLQGNTALKDLQPSVAGKAESSLETKLRKLQLVKHAVVPNLTKSNGNTDDDDGDSEIIEQSSDNTAYRAEPAPLTHVPSNAPHVRPMVTATLEQAMSSPNPHGVPMPELDNLPSTFNTAQDPASAPIFQCRVYTLQDRVVMLDKDGMKQDLVFSVIVKNNELSDYQLMEFDIAVPLGPTTDHTGNRLLETYDGSGATMLSNLRFNVLASFTTMPNSNLRCLLLRLVPRSRKGYISIRDVHELGFILSLAKINEYDTDQRLVTLYTSAYYKYIHEAEPRTDQFTVVIQK